MRSLLVALVTLALVATTGAVRLAASTAPAPTIASPTPAMKALACQTPSVPSWFQRNLSKAIKVSGDLPAKWAANPYIAKIVCWQGPGYRAAFKARDTSYHRWHGLFAMTANEMSTVAGPAQVSNSRARTLTFNCWVWGWAKCPHRVADSRVVQQLIAGIRWIWLNYATPAGAWNAITRTGRFDSYPRPGTDNQPTGRPFARCPVDGLVSYWDDFGQPRYVAGYHPHAGNDIMAPKGRVIRAPFAGLAVKHTGGTRGGNWVTVVGAKGYVQNDHLSRFGHIGWVKFGTIIGYVGMTGDAVVTHDHFEWHPWVLPKPLHKAPSGFSITTDAIDPFPFLNQVCHR